MCRLICIFVSHLFHKVVFNLKGSYEPANNKTNKKWHVRPAKTEISWASVLPVQSLLCAQCLAKDPSFLHTDSEDSDQSGPMPKVIFAGCTCHFVGFAMRWRISFCCCLNHND